MKEIILPSQLKNIEGYLFWCCKKLEKIVIPETVTAIGSHAFGNCSSLIEIRIPRKVTTINDSAFANCDSLQTVTLPETLTELSPDIFYGCNNLADIAISDHIIRIGKNAFQNCVRIKNIYIPNDDTEIENSAFNGCKALENIRLPKSMKKINDNLFSGCEKLKKIEIPYNVEKIGDSAFEFCVSLEEIQLPENVNEIGKRAFEYCSSLKKINLPTGIACISERSFAECKGLNEIILPESIEKIDEYAFYNCISLSDINLPSKLNSVGRFAFSYCPVSERTDFERFTFVIKDGVLLHYDGEKKNIVLPDGISEIGSESITSKPTAVQIPDSVRNIHRDAFISKNQIGFGGPSIGDLRRWNMPKEMNMPEGYLQQDMDCYDADMAILLMDGPWKNHITVIEIAAIMVKQKSKKLIEHCTKIACDHVQQVFDQVMQMLQKEPNKLGIEHAAAFALENENILEKQKIIELYQLAKENKIRKVCTLLEQYSLATGNCEKKTSVCASADPLEVKLREQYTEFELDRILSSLKTIFGFGKTPKITEKQLASVKYANSDKLAPCFVIKCVLAPYIAQLKDRNKKSVENLIFSFSKEADQIADLLDPVSLREMVDSIELCHETLAIKFRFGSENGVTSMGAVIRSANKNKHDTFHIAAKKAICLSNTRSAMVLADSLGWLDEYARFWHTTSDHIRNTKLIDFGLDENGEKVYDLGGHIIEASLMPDLKMALYDKTVGKSVKSLPKRGTDPQKYAEALEDYSDLKKNIRKIVNKRISSLREEFIQAYGIPVREWKEVYLGNVVMNSLARLLVWKQYHGKNDLYFVVSDIPRKSDGMPAELDNTHKIYLAYPSEMHVSEVKQWQQYFAEKGLKQPFSQIWEPVIDPLTIRKDRYQGCMVPYYRFRGMEKHGIYIEDYDFHNDIQIRFDDCRAKVERIDWQRHAIDNEDRFEVKEFSFQKYTRQVNHIVAYLDRITVYDRILKDDVTVETFLPGFTLAQITDFIKLATENNCTNVTALLLNYKNEHFADFDPMEEFTMGDL